MAMTTVTHTGTLTADSCSNIVAGSTGGWNTVPTVPTPNQALPYFYDDTAASGAPPPPAMPEFITLETIDKGTRHVRYTDIQELAMYTDPDKTVSYIVELLRKGEGGSPGRSYSYYITEKCYKDILPLFTEAYDAMLARRIEALSGGLGDK